MLSLLELKCYLEFYFYIFIIPPFCFILEGAWAGGGFTLTNDHLPFSLQCFILLFHN